MHTPQHSPCSPAHSTVTRHSTAVWVLLAGLRSACLDVVSSAAARTWLAAQRYPLTEPEPFVQSVIFLRPMVLTSPAQAEHVCIRLDQHGEFEVGLLLEHASAGHCSGKWGHTLCAEVLGSHPSGTRQQPVSSSASFVDVPVMCRHMESMGLEYGADYQAVRAAWGSSTGAWGELQVLAAAAGQQPGSGGSSRSSGSSSGCSGSGSSSSNSNSISGGTTAAQQRQSSGSSSGKAAAKQRQQRQQQRQQRRRQQQRRGIS